MTDYPTRYVYDCAMELFKAIRAEPGMTPEECDALVKTYFDAFPTLPGAIF